MATPEHFGDEPVLIARRARVPVYISPDRAAAARELLAAHPEVDVVVSDDGLQHYGLARDVEIAVVDGERGFGNRLPLPAGPLREPVARLRTVDAVVVNGAVRDDVPGERRFTMRLGSERFASLAGNQELGPAEFDRRFQGTNLRRPGWRGFLRNVMVALGNDRSQAAEPALIAGIEHPEPLVRAHAAWGLGRKNTQRAQAALRSRRDRESDPAVVSEIAAALDGASP